MQGGASLKLILNFLSCMEIVFDIFLLILLKHLFSADR